MNVILLASTGAWTLGSIFGVNTRATRG